MLVSPNFRKARDKHAGPNREFLPLKDESLGSRSLGAENPFNRRAKFGSSEFLDKIPSSKHLFTRYDKIL
jgi:hypothetical protein